MCIWKPTKVLVIPAMHCKVKPCSPCMLNSVHAAPARVPQDSVTATRVRLQPLRMPGGISALARAALLARLTRACSPGSTGKTSTVEFAVEIADLGVLRLLSIALQRQAPCKQRCVPGGCPFMSSRSGISELSGACSADREERLAEASASHRHQRARTPAGAAARPGS